MIRVCLRTAWRLATLFGGAAAAIAHFGALALRYGGAPPLKERAQWLHCWCAWALPRLGVEVRGGRPAPARGLVVANHLSYLDILVLSAISPALFVAKREVAAWPVFGLMARMAGAIFIRRERPRELPRAIADMQQAMHAGVAVVLFPEGTTTDGASVLAFRSGLMQSAVSAGMPITPTALAYAGDGNAAREVCWWGEMTLLPHLLNLLSKARIVAQVQFCPAPHVWRNRKVAAIFTREQVAAMKNGEAGELPLTVAARPSQAALDAATAAACG